MDKNATLVNATDYLSLSGGYNAVGTVPNPLLTNSDTQVIFTVSGANAFTGVTVTPMLQTPGGNWVQPAVTDMQSQQIVQGSAAINVANGVTKSWAAQFPAGAYVDAKLVLSAISTNSVVAEVTSGKTPQGGVSVLVPVSGNYSSGAPITSLAVASLGTTQNSTPTAAQLLGGVVTQTGATGAGTVTLPTGTQLSAAFGTTPTPGATAFECWFCNLGGSETLTITAATGITLAGTVAVPSGKNAQLKFVNTGANAWTVYCNVSA